jgi:hypothetical protein
MAAAEPKQTIKNDSDLSEKYSVKNNLGLSCAKLRLNWGSMLRLPIEIVFKR